MSEPPSNILIKRFGAKICEGRERWSEITTPTFYDFDARAVDPFHMQRTVNSIQIDLHPAAYERLVDALEYMEGPGRYGDQSGIMGMRAEPSYYERHAQDMLEKKHREARIREEHPLLQDLWNQYQMTLNLIQSGKGEQGD